MAYSWRGSDLAWMKIVAIALSGLTGVAAAHAVDFMPPTQALQSPAPRGVVATPGPEVPPPLGHVCFNVGETRDKIAAHRLSDPLRALRAGRLQGEALRAKLCRFKQDDYVYEVFVLRRDGRIVRLYMNAQTGAAIPAPNDN